MSEVGLIITPMSRLLFHHHGVDPKIPRPRFANGSRSEVPLDTGFNQPISIAAESALKEYGLWAPGDPVRRDSPVGRVRHLLAKMVRRHAVYAERPVPTEDRVVLTLGVGSSTDTLVIEMRLRPATIYVRTFGTFSVPRKGETTTKVYEREYTCAQIVAAGGTYPCDPIHIARVLTAIAYPNNSTPRTHSRLIEMLPPPPRDDLLGRI